MERLLNVTTILSILLMAMVLFSVRRSHIRVEYSVSWLAAAADSAGAFALVLGARLDRGATGPGRSSAGPAAPGLLRIRDRDLSALGSHLGSERREHRHGPAAGDSLSFSCRSRQLNEKQQDRKGKTFGAPVAVAAQPHTDPLAWIYWAGLIIALFAPCIEVYWPAFTARFSWTILRTCPTCCPSMYDLATQELDAADASAADVHLLAEFPASGNADTFGYHFVNLLLHFFNGVLIFLAVRKVLDWARLENPPRRILAIFAAGTLSVSSDANRIGELYRQPIGNAERVLCAGGVCGVPLSQKRERVECRELPSRFWLSSARPVLSKEHTAVLPALLILTDYYWNPGFSLDGIRRNWKLYVPIRGRSRGCVVFVFRDLERHSNSAGFRNEGPHLVSVLLHAVPGDLGLHAAVSAAVRPESGLRFPVLAHACSTMVQSLD